MVSWWTGCCCRCRSLVRSLVRSFAGVSLWQIRQTKPWISKDYDVVISCISLLVGGILIFQGWRLDPLLLFGQLMTTGAALSFAVEALRLRNEVYEQEEREALGEYASSSGYGGRRRGRDWSEGGGGGGRWEGGPPPQLPPPEGGFVEYPGVQAWRDGAEYYDGEYGEDDGGYYYYDEGEDAEVEVEVEAEEARVYDTTIGERVEETRVPPASFGFGSIGVRGDGGEGGVNTPFDLGDDDDF